MSKSPHAAVMIEQVQALNRLFLAHLHEELRAGSRSYGLTPPVGRALVALGSAELDRVAGLPRALFRLNLASGVAAAPTPGAEGRRALHLTLLLTAAQASRQHPVLARFFFGLDTETQSLLGTLPLGEYLRVAGLPGLVTCAFARRPFLWQAWLKAESGLLPTELVLLALQPEVRARGTARVQQAGAARSLA